MCLCLLHVYYMISVCVLCCVSVSEDVRGNGKATGRHAGDDSVQSERSSLGVCRQVPHFSGL